MTPQLCTGGAYLIIEGPCALGEVLFIAEFVPEKVGEGGCGKGVISGALALMGCFEPRWPRWERGI